MHFGMALGRQGDRQGDLVVTWREMPLKPIENQNGTGAGLNPTSADTIKRAHPKPNSDAPGTTPTDYPSPYISPTGSMADGNSNAIRIHLGRHRVHMHE